MVALSVVVVAVSVKVMSILAVDVNPPVSVAVTEMLYAPPGIKEQIKLYITNTRPCNTVIFSAAKNDKFLLKNLDFFFLFLPKTLIVGTR